MPIIISVTFGICFHFPLLVNVTNSSNQDYMQAKNSYCDLFVCNKLAVLY